MPEVDCYTQPDTAILAQLAVHPSCRGQGVAERLMDIAEDWAHAQGYADANFLIPELVSGVQFRKGPYYAENGDFSSAGSANINYFNVLDRPIVSFSGGSFDYGRFLAGAGFGSGEIAPDAA